MFWKYFFTVHLKIALKKKYESLLNLSWGQYKFNSACLFSLCLWWLWRLRLILNLGTVKIQNCKFLFLHIILTEFITLHTQPTSWTIISDHDKRNQISSSSQITLQQTDLKYWAPRPSWAHWMEHTKLVWEADTGSLRPLQQMCRMAIHAHEWGLYASINSATSDNTTVISAALVTDKRRTSVLQKWPIQSWMFAFSEATEWTYRVFLERVEWCAS